MRHIWRTAAWLLRARLVLEGAEHLPVDGQGRRRGGWIAAVVPHRTWIDPFVPWILLPERPRFVFFGDSRAMARSPLRRFLVRRLGGVIPIPSSHDPGAVEVHIAAAAAALDAGAVLMLMPETGAPSDLGRLRRLGGGMAYFALRTGAPIVPLVLGGNDELYLGRRILLRALRPIEPLELAGLGPGAATPEPGSRLERDAARRLTGAFAQRVAGAVAEVHLAALPPPGTRKRGRFLTRLFR
jgi:1-acyl-sn-glycerol-3-phosphate acyltransferase